MFVRRRPLLRAAAIGGGAYVAGQRRAAREAQQSEYQADQDSRITELEQNQAAASGPPQGSAQGGGVPSQSSPSMLDQLQQLTDLHQQGALSDAEFAAAKSKLLGS